VIWNAGSVMSAPPVMRQFAVYCTAAGSDDSKNDPREDSP
jgi:hypothetical protein